MDSCAPPESAADSSANEAPSSRRPFGCHSVRAQTSWSPSTSEWSPASSAGQPCSYHPCPVSSVVLPAREAEPAHSCISPLRPWSLEFPQRSYHRLFSALSRSYRHPSGRGCIPEQTPPFFHLARPKPIAVFSLALQNCPIALPFPWLGHTQNKSYASLPVFPQLRHQPRPPSDPAARLASFLLLCLVPRCPPGSFPSSARSARQRFCESPLQTASSRLLVPASAV